MGRKPYAKPAARKIDSQGAEGKRLLEKIRDRERRRSQRARVRIPVQIHLSLPNGGILQQEGLTQVVNAHGCLFGMEAKVEAGQHVTLLNPKSGLKQSSTVVSAQGLEAGYSVAVEFDTATPRLWSPVFPQEDQKT